MEEDFNKYIEDIKILPVKEKESIAIEQLKILATLTNTMCTQLGINNELMINREVLDLKNDDYTRDDFVEATIVYANSIQNSLCDLTDKITEIMEEQVGPLD